MITQHDEQTSRQCPTLSVVLSFRNEAAVLPELLRQLRAVLRPLKETGALRDYELIFINDLSTDGSEALLRHELSRAPDVRLINMSRNFGISPCVLAGMAYASGDAVVYMDTDLQDPPPVIAELLQVWQQDPRVDVVHTVRSRRLGETAFKRALTRLGYQILQSVSTIHLPIEAGDFKLLSRKVVKHLLDFPEKSPYLRGLVCWVGFEQRFVTYERAARFAGDTHFPVLSVAVISNFFNSALLAFSGFPLRLALYAGIGACLPAACVSAWMCLRGLQGIPLEGWSWVLLAVLWLGAAQLIGLGLLGLYVYAILQEARQRPQYIVREALGFPPSSAR
ncbi:MAG: glycosyltransferase family 2 protein [Myxococcota bacterium]